MRRVLQYGSLVFVLYAIISIDSISAQNREDPSYFLNNKEVDLTKTFINPKQIDSIHVNKQTTRGGIYFYTKSLRPNLLSISQILNNYSDLEADDKDILFQVNGKILSDTSDVRIDASFYIYLEVVELSKVKYLPEKYNGLRIAIIEYSDEQKKNEIRIRGDLELIEGME